MSELLSAIEGYRTVSLAELPDAAIEDGFEELHRAAELIEVERLRWLEQADRRRPFERDGHLSAASWLASRFKVAWGAAREHVRMARSLADMPVAREALQRGELSLSAVRVLATAREADPAAFSSAEQPLVEAARIHSTDDLRRVAAYWRQAVEREHALEGEEKMRERRRLHASVTLMGWSASTATSIRRRARRCSPRSGRSWTPKRDPEGTTDGPRRRRARTRWARSVVSGSIARIDRPWQANARTSR